MTLVAFMQAGNGSVYAGSWRHPAADLRSLEASDYAELGRDTILFRVGLSVAS
jgi:hypothetical protein